MTKTTLFAALTAALMSFAPQATASENQCLELGGVAIPNFFGEGENQPIIISATLIGSVTNAAGKITEQRKTRTGLEMVMEHYFGREDGGAIRTNDIAVLTAIPEKPGRYMIEITYHIQHELSRGTLKDYKGSFKSYGLVDLRDPQNLQGLVRYSGEICR